MMAMWEGAVGASRFEDEEAEARMIWEREVEERRGRVAIVWEVILRI
jgi:hypothetical protein